MTAAIVSLAREQGLARFRDLNLFEVLMGDRAEATLPILSLILDLPYESAAAREGKS